MEVRCSLCGRPENIEKWSAAHERLRQGGSGAPYVCEACQRRVQRDALQSGRSPRPL